MYGLNLTLKNEIVKIAPKGRVNCVAPGWVRTPMAEEALKDPQMVYRVLSTTPLKKVAMPIDVATQVVVLASSTLSGHVTGQVVMVEDLLGSINVVALVIAGGILRIKIYDVCLFSLDIGYWTTLSQKKMNTSSQSQRFAGWIDTIISLPGWAQGYDHHWQTQESVDIMEKEGGLPMDHPRAVAAGEILSTSLRMILAPTGASLMSLKNTKQPMLPNNQIPPAIHNRVGGGKRVSSSMINLIVFRNNWRPAKLDPHFLGTFSRISLRTSFRMKKWLSSLFGAGSEATAACYPKAQEKVLRRSCLSVFVGGLTDIPYKDICIPEGAIVFGNHWYRMMCIVGEMAISRDPNIYPNPDKFDGSTAMEKSVRTSSSSSLHTVLDAGRHIVNRSIFINLALLLWSFKIMQDPENPIDQSGCVDGVIAHPKRFAARFEPRFGDEGLLRAVMAKYGEGL
ncbi:hypothetical protein C8R48DRAFT_677083 [Suillus tomentosus]|nr:hypothetical protein C8R48DRAFT_677083 [Suillus tomentosus]